MRNIQTVQVEDTTTYPVAASLAGTNAFYLDFCNFGGHRPAYAACLNRIATIKAGSSLNGNYNDCTNAICSGNCQAMTLRDEELEAGRAIYYINRSKQQEANDRNLQAVGGRINRNPVEANKIKFTPRPESASKPRVEPAVEEKSFVGTSSAYADAINRVLAKQQELANESESSHPETVVVSSKSKVSTDFKKSDADAPKATGAKVMQFESGLTLAQIAARMKKNGATT